MTASGPRVRLSSPFHAQKGWGRDSPWFTQGEFSVSSCLLGTHAVSIAFQPACQEVTWLLSREGVLQSGDVFSFQWSEKKKLLA